MTDETTDQINPDHDEDTTEAPAAPSGVRVPNVRPGAVSGLDHQLLDPTAAAAAELDTATTERVEVDVDAELVRISGLDDETERRDAADALWKHQTKDDPNADYSELADAIRVAVYGESRSAEEIAGETVESETAGTGDAENAETGEVTPGGEPLPTIEQDGGEQLDPADETPGDATEDDTTDDEQDGSPDATA